MSEPDSAPRKESTGCLFKGCLGVLVVALGLLAAFGWGAYTLYQQVYELTSDQPGEVPAFTPDPQTWADFQRRWESATARWQAGQPATLKVNGDDLNNLLYYGLPKDDNPRRFFLEIKDKTVRLHASVRLDGIEGYQGRYFNGVVQMVPMVQDGFFFLDVTEINTGSLKAPPQLMRTQQYFDWASWLDRLGLRQKLDLADKVEIKDGTLILQKD